MQKSVKLGKTLDVSLDKTLDPQLSRDTEFADSRVRGASQNFWQVLVVMVGFTFFTPSMLAGGTLGLGLTLRQFLLAIIIGNLVLSFYTAALAHIGQKTGLSLDLLARHSFGRSGSILPSLLVGLTQMGWFGVGVAMFALPVSNLLGINTYLLVLIVGALMTLTSLKGIDALSFFGSIAVPLITLLGFYSIYLSVQTAGGLSNVFPQVPAQPITMVAALNIVIGNFISGGTSTPNFTRFARSNKAAIWATVIAFFAGNILMFVFGATGAAVFGKADIFDVLILQGLTIPAILSLGLNIWSTNNNALYTSGLSLTNVSRAPMKVTTILSGVIGTVTAVFLYNNFVGYLSLLGSMIPPVGVVLILHYFLHKTDYEEDNPSHQWNMAAIVSVLAGIVIGLLVPGGISSINSLIATGVIYLVLHYFSQKNFK